MVIPHVVQVFDKSLDIFGQEDSAVAEAKCWFWHLATGQEIHYSMRRGVKFPGHLAQQSE
jgi:hypothetical protein